MILKVLVDLAVFVAIFVVVTAHDQEVRGEVVLDHRFVCHSFTIVGAR